MKNYKEEISGYQCRWEKTSYSITLECFISARYFQIQTNKATSREANRFRISLSVRFPRNSDEKSQKDIMRATVKY